MATLAERLHVVLAKLSPELRLKLEQGESWGERGAPYAIDEWRGKVRITVTDPETGDTVAGTGATTEEALTALEAKVP
jgi:hypothetical protein